MPAPDSALNWLCWIAGIAVAVSGTLLALRALVGFRQRGARRCPRCRYDLATAPVPTAESPATCPECARIITSERALTRRNRPRRLVLLGLAIALAGRTLWAVPDTRAHGWPRLVPATLIAFAAPALGPAWLDGPWWQRGPIAHRAVRVAQDFLDRDSEGRLWAWQSDLFARLTSLGARALGRAGVGPDREVLDRLESARLEATLEATPTELYEAFTAATGIPVDRMPEPFGAAASPVVELRWRKLPPYAAFAMIGAGDYGVDKLWRVRNGILTSDARASHTDPNRVNRVGVLDTGDVPLDRATLLAVISSIAPEDWVDAGGYGARLSFCGRWAIVDAPPGTLWRIERLLDDVRRARTGAPPAQITSARRVLATLASMHHELDQPLDAGIDALVVALENRNVPVSLDASAHFAAAMEPGHAGGPPTTSPPSTAIDALDEVARAKHGTWITLTWDIVGEGIVLVDADLRPALGVTLAYNVADLIGTEYTTSVRRPKGSLPAAGSTLLASIRESVDIEHWQENGGELGWIRAGDGMLVVHTTVRNHVAIDDLLTRARRATR